MPAAEAAAQLPASYKQHAVSAAAPSCAPRAPRRAVTKRPLIRSARRARPPQGHTNQHPPLPSSPQPAVAHSTPPPAALPRRRRREEPPDGRDRRRRERPGPDAPPARRRPRRHRRQHRPLGVVPLRPHLRRVVHDHPLRVRLEVVEDGVDLALPGRAAVAHALEPVWGDAPVVGWVGAAGWEGAGGEGRRSAGAAYRWAPVSFSTRPTADASFQGRGRRAGGPFAAPARRRGPNLPERYPRTDHEQVT